MTLRWVGMGCRLVIRTVLVGIKHDIKHRGSVQWRGKEVQVSHNMIQVLYSKA